MPSNTGRSIDAVVLAIVAILPACGRQSVPLDPNVQAPASDHAAETPQDHTVGDWLTKAGAGPFGVDATEASLVWAFGAHRDVTRDPMPAAWVFGLHREAPADGWLMLLEQVEGLPGAIFDWEQEADAALDGDTLVVTPRLPWPCSAGTPLRRRHDDPEDGKVRLHRSGKNARDGRLVATRCGHAVDLQVGRDYDTLRSDWQRDRAMLLLSSSLLPQGWTLDPGGALRRDGVPQSCTMSWIVDPKEDGQPRPGPTGPHPTCQDAIGTSKVEMLVHGGRALPLSPCRKAEPPGDGWCGRELVEPP